MHNMYLNFVMILGTSTLFSALIIIKYTCPKGLFILQIVAFYVLTSQTIRKQKSPSLFFRVDKTSTGYI